MEKETTPKRNYCSPSYVLQHSYVVCLEPPNTEGERDHHYLLINIIFMTGRVLQNIPILLQIGVYILLLIFFLFDIWGGGMISLI